MDEFSDDSWYATIKTVIKLRCRNFVQFSAFHVNLLDLITLSRSGEENNKIDVMSHLLSQHNQVQFSLRRHELFF